MHLLGGRRHVMDSSPPGASKKRAEAFGEFFSSKIRLLRESLDAEASQKEVLLGDTGGFIHRSHDVLQSFSPISPTEVMQLTSKSPTKSCELDPLPCCLLKRVLHPPGPAIADIVNMSLSQGSFPLPLKEAIITPVLKKTSLDPVVLSNYRPVAGLSFPSKTIERVVLCIFYRHLETNGLFPVRQSAYRVNHSTETALLEVSNGVLRAIDDGDSCTLLFLDMSSAFDTVDHDLLIKRLEQQCGFSGTVLKWCKDYLTDRSQAVVIGDTFSSSFSLRYGVPQGSILGPVLFLIHTSSVSHIVASHTGVEEHH